MDITQFVQELTDAGGLGIIKEFQQEFIKQRPELNMHTFIEGKDTSRDVLWGAFSWQDTTASATYWDSICSNITTKDSSETVYTVFVGLCLLLALMILFFTLQGCGTASNKFSAKTKTRTVHSTYTCVNDSDVNDVFIYNKNKE